jgi:thymidylate synthase (FAD)
MDDRIFSAEPRIELIALSKSPSDSAFGPEQLSAYGALGCFEEQSAAQLYEGTEPGSRAKKEEIVLRESAGRGHGSVADQNYFTFSIENLTRAATLQLCLPHYLAHLQQSLRRATADRAFYLPKEIRESPFYNDVRQTLMESFNLYNRMSEKVPKEDARYLLPLYTKTNIQTSGDARELMHLSQMTKAAEVPSSAAAVVEGMLGKASSVAPNLFKDWGYNYEVLAWYPAAQLYSPTNKTGNDIIRHYNMPGAVVYFERDMSDSAIDDAVKNRNETELANLKHVHNSSRMEGFLVPMSLACFHQSIRQRTWDHSVESIYDAAARDRAIVPPSVRESVYLEQYERQHSSMMELYRKLVKSGVSRKEAIGVVPHSLQIYDFVHVNGWNSVHSIGKRTCTEAQWEIRSLANQIASIIRGKNKILGNYTYPQGVVYGKCPEKKPCGLCDKILKAREEQAKLKKFVG